VDLNKVN